MIGLQWENGAVPAKCVSKTTDQIYLKTFEFPQFYFVKTPIVWNKVDKLQAVVFALHAFVLDNMRFSARAKTAAVEDNDLNRLSTRILLPSHI